jgi:hypothetical protein
MLSRTSTLEDDGWRIGTILPFDARCQYLYLHGPEPRQGATDPWLARSLDWTTVRRFSVPWVATDPATEDDYFESLGTLFPFYDRIVELLGSPSNLDMIRSMKEHGKPLDFRNRTEIYLQTTR